eukprot:g5162.t1
MDDQKQADVVDEMMSSAGKFNGSGFSEWYEQALDCFRLRGQGILSIVQGQPCPEPVYQAVRRSRCLSRERRHATAGSRALAAQADAAAAATADDAATETAIAAGNDNDGGAAAARRAAIQAASAAATAAAAAADCFEGNGGDEESSDGSSPSPRDAPVAFTYASATELPTSVLWAMPQNIINRDEIRKWHVDNMMLGTFLSMCTTGAAKKFVATFKPKPDMMSNGIVAWKALVEKYRNPSRQRQKKPAGNASGGRKGDWCTFHRTSRHDNSTCREQNNRNNGGGGLRGRQQRERHQGQRNHGNRFNDGDQQRGQHRNVNGYNSFHGNAPGGQHQQTVNNAPQANNGRTPVAPSTTTMVEYYNPAGQQAPGSATTAAPAAGVGLPFIADSTAPAPTFTMTVSIGASSHFLDSELLPELEQSVIEYTKFDPPLVITVAGQGQLHGTAKGALKVTATDQHGDPRSVRLPFICVPKLGRHLVIEYTKFDPPLVITVAGQGQLHGTAKGALKLVSMDVLGPISPTAIGGYNYMAKFTDHASRLKAVYFIAKKSDAFASLVNFIQDIAIPLGLRVEYLRSHNEGEFVNSEFRQYCKTTGIVQQFSSPHTPQQNGISERDSRTIMNMARCLLNEANLPKHLWGEIAATSVFLINRLPHKALKGDTPYCRMFGKQANLSFLRIIGSRAFVHVEGHTTKLQPQAWEGVLVGYDNDSPTFRIYNRTTGRITSSRNVTFIESPPAILPAASPFQPERVITASPLDDGHGVFFGPSFQFPLLDKMDGLLHDVRQEAWGGLIPTELSMDSSEVTSLQRPLPLYLLLPRMGYLPCVADAISHHFGEVAPDAQRTLWLEETRSGEPLRWHIPTGVLFDLIAGGRGGGGEEGAGVAGGAASGGSAKYVGGPWSGSGSCAVVLPWRITVHFQGCPRRQVFPLEKEADIRRHYTNALKQALYLQSGSSRAGMTLAKENQNRLWQALKTNDAQVFHEMDALLGGDRAIRLVPVRLVMGSAPPSQLPIPAKRPDGTPFTLRDSLCWFCPNEPWEKAEGAAEESSQQPEAENKAEQPQKGGGEGNGSGAIVHAVGVDGGGAGLEGADDDSGRREEWTKVVGSGGVAGGERALSPPRVTVQGVDVPLGEPIVHLWAALRHPDHFLYIVVRR